MVPARPGLMSNGGVAESRPWEDRLKAPTKDVTTVFVCPVPDLSSVTGERVGSASHSKKQQQELVVWGTRLTGIDQEPARSRLVTCSALEHRQLIMVTFWDPKRDQPAPHWLLAGPN